MQERWLARTRHMLTFTDNSIKSIAVDMGISDIHHFNKKVRRLLGESPSAIRKQGIQREAQQRTGTEPAEPLTASFLQRPGKGPGCSKE